jgi:hypothetical protein
MGSVARAMFTRAPESRCAGSELLASVTYAEGTHFRTVEEAAVSAASAIFDRLEGPSVTVLNDYPGIDSAIGADSAIIAQVAGDGLPEGDFPVIVIETTPDGYLGDLVVQCQAKDGSSE